MQSFVCLFVCCCNQCSTHKNALKRINVFFLCVALMLQYFATLEIVVVIYGFSFMFFMFRKSILFFDRIFKMTLFKIQYQVNTIWNIRQAVTRLKKQLNNRTFQSDGHKSKEKKRDKMSWTKKTSFSLKK